MGGFSIELLEDGCRAVDPLARLRYEIHRAPDNAELTVAPLPPSEASPLVTRPSAPPPSSSAPRPSSARPASRMAVIAQRDHDPSPTMPLSLRERALLVPPGTSDDAAAEDLVAMFFQIRAELASAPPGKLIQLAAFDMMFSGKPPVAPRDAVVERLARAASGNASAKADRDAAPVFPCRRSGRTAHRGGCPDRSACPRCSGGWPAASSGCGSASGAGSGRGSGRGPAGRPPVVAAPPPAVVAPPAPPLPAPPRSQGNPFMDVAPPSAPSSPLRPSSTGRASRPPAPAWPLSPATCRSVRSAAIIRRCRTASPRGRRSAAGCRPCRSPVAAPAVSVSAPLSANGSTAAPARSVRVAHRSSDDLIADLFDATSELHYLADAVQAADFCAALTEKLRADAAIVYLYNINRREFVATAARGAGTESLVGGHHGEGNITLRYAKAPPCHGRSRGSSRSIARAFRVARRNP